MRVLVVEDDRALGLFLPKGAEDGRHEVESVGDGETAVEHAVLHHPDLMVLDLSLPRLDGIGVLEQKHRFPNTSVLVLTGRSQMEERVRCLDLGADDCLLKPFSFHELSARCRALLRRRKQFESPLLKFGELEMNRMEAQSARTEGSEGGVDGERICPLLGGAVAAPGSLLQPGRPAEGSLANGP